MLLEYSIVSSRLMRLAAARVSLHWRAQFVSNATNRRAHVFSKSVNRRARFFDLDGRRLLPVQFCALAPGVALLARGGCDEDETDPAT